MPGARIVVFAFILGSSLAAQRAFESDANVIYEDAQGRRMNLGTGFSPVLTHDGLVAMLRGRRFDYGDDFDCAKRDSRNWVSLYNPATKKETVLFDRAIRFDNFPTKFCVFWQMQLSYERSVLYLVGRVYATSGSLAIISLTRGSITYVPGDGVNEVYVIQTGPHRDELILVQRVMRKTSVGDFYPAYPFIHAHADGLQIKQISDEYFTRGGNDKVPLLRNYLRKIGGTIIVRGKTLP